MTQKSRTGKTRRPDSLNFFRWFNFTFEDRYLASDLNDGGYDTHDHVIYVYGAHTAESAVETLSHEVLHATVHKVAGKVATKRYDKICDEVEK